MKNSNGRDSAVGPAPPLSTRGKMDGALLMISDDTVALGNWFRTTICCKRSSHVARLLLQSARAGKFGKFILVGSAPLCFSFSAASSAYFSFGLKNNATQTDTQTGTDSKYRSPLLVF